MTMSGEIGAVSTGTPSSSSVAVPPDSGAHPALRTSACTVIGVFCRGGAGAEAWLA